MATIDVNPIPVCWTCDAGDTYNLHPMFSFWNAQHSCVSAYSGDSVLIERCRTPLSNFKHETTSSESHGYTHTHITPSWYSRHAIYNALSNIKHFSEWKVWEKMMEQVVQTVKLSDTLVILGFIYIDLIYVRGKHSSTQAANHHHSLPKHYLKCTFLFWLTTKN